MKGITFLIGIALLFASVLKFKGWEVSTSDAFIFGGLLLLSLFQELDEFDFFGAKGKKVDKELRDLETKVEPYEDATNPSPQEKDELTKLKESSIQLMGVDRGNFLAIVFEIERLLRLVAQIFYPDKVNERTSPRKIVDLLKDHGYLTTQGVNQVQALIEVRNLIVHGRIGNTDDEKLNSWIELAYNLYKEISNDLQGRTSPAAADENNN